MEQKLTKTWDVSAFDRVNNEWTTTQNHAYEVTPEIPDFINQAAPTVIKPTRRVKPQRTDQLAIIIPDAQIPFHDETALQLAHLAVAELQPDRIILLGDMIDLPAQSRFDTHPAHTSRLQEQLDRTHLMLSQFRADSPNSQFDYIIGNHEIRLTREVIQKNAELLGIKRANAAKELSVLTLDFLLRLDELDVDMSAQYPNGQVWLNDHTVAVHGDTSSSNGSTSLKYLARNPSVSTIHGHSHRAEIQWKTTQTRSGYEQRFAMSPGTIADIRGSVPSYGSSIGHSGQSETRVENWQQAIGLIEYNDRMANPELAMISNGTMRIRGQQFELPKGA